MVSGELIDPRQKLVGSLPGQIHYGLPGKSAYQYAVEAGYTGTEKEFAKKLASESSGDVDPEEIKKIVDEYLEENPPAGGNVDLTGYATEEYVQEYAQPKGEYLTEVPSGYAQKSEIPTKVSQLQNDKGYLTEHQDISGKLDSSELPTAINTALSQAKASGEFDGAAGKTPVRGTDYWTAADIAEIKTYVDNAILGGAW